MYTETRFDKFDALYSQLERFREFNSAELEVRNWFFSSGQFRKFQEFIPTEQRWDYRRRGNRKGWPGTKEKEKKDELCL